MNVEYELQGCLVAVSKSGNPGPGPVYQAEWSGRQMFRTAKIA